MFKHNLNIEESSQEEINKLEQYIKEQVVKLIEEIEKQIYTLYL